MHTGSQVKCIKNRIDEIDLEKFSYKYSLIEADGKMDKLEKITYDVKFEPTADGGSKNKMSSTYYTNGDVVLSEEEIKEGKEKALAVYKGLGELPFAKPRCICLKVKYVSKDVLLVLHMCCVAVVFACVIRMHVTHL